MHRIPGLINAARNSTTGTNYKGTAEGYLQQAINIVLYHRDITKTITSSEAEDMINDIKKVGYSLEVYL